MRRPLAAVGLVFGVLLCLVGVALAQSVPQPSDYWQCAEGRPCESVGFQSSAGSQDDGGLSFDFSRSSPGASGSYGRLPFSAGSGKAGNATTDSQGVVFYDGDAGPQLSDGANYHGLLETSTLTNNIWQLRSSSAFHLSSGCIVRQFSPVIYSHYTPSCICGLQVADAGEAIIQCDPLAPDAGNVANTLNPWTQIKLCSNSNTSTSLATYICVGPTTGN